MSAAIAAANRPPMDGERTEDIGMLSTPIVLEHGNDSDDPATPPVMCMNLVLHPDPALLFDVATGDEWNEPDMLDDVYDRIQRHMEATYVAKGEDCSVDFNVQDISWMKGRPEVYIEVEVCAGLYRGAESLEAWIDRATAGTPFWSIYNRFVIFFTGQREVEDMLRKAA